MPISIDLSGQVALVTGSSQGIGAAIAQRLHEAGAAVVINHPNLPDGSTQRDASALEQSLNRQRPDSAFVAASDVADPDAVSRMMESIKQQAGSLDILVNNAGILRDRSVAKMTLDEWNAVIGTNLSGVFHCAKFGLEIMRDGGRIVNIGSLAATAGFHGQANYSAAKAGVHALTKVLARECSKRGIRVNAIAPGVIDTPMMQRVAETVREGMAKAIPLGRFGAPDEIATAALFLVSPLASYISGSILEVNGGWQG